MKKNENKTKGGVENFRPSNKIKAGSECRIKPSEQELWELSKMAVLAYNAGFCDVYKFINRFKIVPIPVLIKVLRAVIKYRPDNCWAYGTKIVDEQTKNFNAGKNIEEHERIKKEEAQGMKGFGNILKKILATD